jgi:hypothetical protein
MKQISFTFILILAFCVFSFAQDEIKDCPKIKIIAPESMMNLDEPIYFSVELKTELEKLNSKYDWQIINANIVEGLGTSKIKIKPNSDGIEVTATVTITGLPNQCKNTASEFVNITPAIKDLLETDEYGKLSRKDELARLDNFSARLFIVEDFQGIIHIRTGKNESNKSIKKHIRFMMNYFKFREFPKERVIFVIEKSNERRTTLWSLPKDFKFQICENCEILKGADL